MQRLMMICALAVPVIAAAQDGGQATVVSGYASNRVVLPGVTVLTDAPLIHTPSVTLDADPLSAAHGGFATLSYYGPGTVSEVTVEPSVALASGPDRNFMNVGVHTLEDSEGVATLMAKQQQPTRRVATRVYTNWDIALLVYQLDQTVGMVKYGNTTTRLY